MKRFFIILSYGVLLAVIVFLFEMIISGRFCSCRCSPCTTHDDLLIPVLT